MLNKEEVLLKIRKLNLPKHQYCLMTGAALVLHGVKSHTRDLDIGCSGELFQWLLQNGYEQQQVKSFEGIIIDDCIEVFRNWWPEKIVYVEDIPVADIYSIRKYKQELARTKDLEDIKRIDEFLQAKVKFELESGS